MRIKRITAFLVVLCLMLAAVPAMAAENDVLLLKDLGMLETEEEYLTRRELAAAVVRTMGSMGEIEPFDTVFSDVKRDDTMSGYIQTAYTLGILNGFSDGKFYPYDTVTTYQAVKALVCMTGYEVRALLFGGYPNGYLQVAREVGILQGVAVGEDTPIATTDFARLLKNALNTDVLQRVSYGAEEGDTYAATPGETLLTRQHKIYKMEGTLTATYLSSLVGEGTAKENQIAIDDVLFRTETDFSDRLGQKLTFYIREGGGTDSDTVLAAESRSGQNAELIVAADDVEGIAETSLRYIDASDKVRTAELESGFYLIYNGRGKLTYTLAELADCDLRLIDSDNNGSYDVVFATKYVHLVVDAVQASKDTIYTKTNAAEYSRIVLDEKQDIKAKITNADGTAAELEAFAEWDVISVAKSADGKVFDIRRSTERVTGSCTETGDDFVRIGDTFYDVDPGLAANAKLDPVENGREGTFLLAFDKTVVAVDYTGASNTKYGYLVGAAGGKGLSTDADIRVFSEDNTFVVLGLASRVKVNGAPMNEKDALDILAPGGVLVNQLVCYAVSPAGEISEISTAADGTALSREERVRAFTKDGEYASVRFRGSPFYMIQSRFILDACTIFQIPADITSEKDFGVVKATVFAADEDLHNVAIFDVDMDNRAQAMTLTSAARVTVGHTASIGVVTAVSKAMTENGETVPKLWVFAEGGEVELMPTTEDFEGMLDSVAIADAAKEEGKNAVGGVLNKTIPISNVEVGDIVQYTKDSAGRLTGLRVLLRGGSRVFKETMYNNAAGAATPSENNVYSPSYSGYVTVDAKIENGIRVMAPNPGNADAPWERAFVFSSGTRVIRYDSTRKTAESISVNDIAAGDTIFLNANYSNVLVVIVYE